MNSSKTNFNTKQRRWKILLAGCLTLFLVSVVFAQEIKPAEISDKKTESTQTTSTRVDENSTTVPTAEADKPNADKRLTAVRSQIVLKVINPDDSRAQIKKLTREMGGFAIRITDTSIVVKIPPGKLTNALETFAKQGVVVQKNIERADLTLEIAQLEGKLQSQSEILTKLRSFFDDSDFAATLKIEQSMTRLVLEIERVKGRLRLLRDQSKWCVIEINFNFRERENVIYVSSPFEWLNDSNLSTFLEDF